MQVIDTIKLNDVEDSLQQNASAWQTFNVHPCASRHSSYQIQAIFYCKKVVIYCPVITAFVNLSTSDVPSEALAFTLFIEKWAEADDKRS
jgi:hypothetical protein